MVRGRGAVREGLSLVKAGGELIPWLQHDCHCAPGEWVAQTLAAFIFLITRARQSHISEPVSQERTGSASPSVCTLNW